MRKIHLKIAGIVALALVVGSVIPLLLAMLLFPTGEKGIVAAVILVSMAWCALVGWCAVNEVKMRKKKKTVWWVLKRDNQYVLGFEETKPRRSPLMLTTDFWEAAVWADAEEALRELRRYLPKKLQQGIRVVQLDVIEQEFGGPAGLNYGDDSVLDSSAQ